MVTSAEEFPFDANCVTVRPATVVARLLHYTSEYITRVRTKAPIYFVMSVCPNVISAFPTPRISVKFGTGTCYENLSGQCKMWLKSGKNIGYST